jgi:alpha-tubulin suppressor-like RCC1 family protein
MLVDRIPESVRMVAAGDDYSVFLTILNNIYVCGSKYVIDHTMDNNITNYILPVHVMK